MLKPERTSVYAQYTVLVPRRERVQAVLQEAGIPTAVHYPIPLNQQPAYRQHASSGATAMSEWMSRHVMSLPMGPDLTDADAERVVGALAKAVA